MYGKLYGVGVGPGDPELLTLKAARLIREKEYIAVPGAEAEKTTAYQIAVQAVPELATKRLIPVYMPMTHDARQLEENRQKGARLLESVLKEGHDIVFLTLGDPTVYSTFSYLRQRVEADGYPTGSVSGVTSFCAAAARMNLSLSEWDEPLHILPAVHHLKDRLDQKGTYILMKSGKQAARVKEIIKESGREAVMVENCGMENERICNSVEEIPDDAGYYSLIIAKEPKARHD